jgi:hypothetical protein
MFHLLDETLEAFLRAEVPLPPRQVDISFSAPDQDWGAKVSRPTVNLFLWDIRQNLAERLAGSEMVEQDGRKYRRTPPPRVDCRYLVTAWTTEVGDEHQLLGAILVSFLSHHELSTAYLQGPLAKMSPLPTVSVASPAETTSSDFWSALGGKLKPGLDLVVTATVDTGLMKEAGPPVEQYELHVKKRFRQVAAGGGRLVGGRVTAGEAASTIYSPRGVGLSRSSGEFLVRGEPGDTVEAFEEGSGDRATTLIPLVGAVDLTRRPADKPAEAKSRPKRTAD